MFYLLTHFAVLLFICYALEKELTVIIDPRKVVCFYQNVRTAQIIELEYQVIDGGHGDLDITFNLADASGRIWVTDYKKSENTHTHQAKVDGDYRFCFDNTFSAFNAKTIFFEFLIDGDDTEDIDWDFQGRNKISSHDIDGMEPKEKYGMKLQSVLQSVNSVRMSLNKVRHLQELIKSSEARDRNLAEENYFIVNTYSAIQIMMMSVVGFIQVVMVKSLLDDSSRVSNIWTKFNQRLYG